jgi:cell division transport system permease protein
MFARISYAFRETLASFRRNLTLTGAAIVVAAVALMFFGIALLIQSAFSNLLVKWKDGVEMIVYINPGATAEQIATVQQQLVENAAVDPAGVVFQDQAATYAQAQKVLAGQPSLLQTLSVEKMPSQLRVRPAPNTEELLPSLKAQFEGVPFVKQVALATDTIKFYGKLSSFVRTVTIVFAIVLLLVALILIWTTIRTAMFARRREIEVMKLVGATNWFIRVPFMLEGLFQGLIGAMISCVGLLTVNSLWNGSLKEFGTKDAVTNDLLALQVTGSYLQFVMISILIIGALAGAVGAGLAATKFLDV